MTVNSPGFIQIMQTQKQNKAICMHIFFLKSLTNFITLSGLKTHNFSGDKH
jgi:hypothetical protein